jgi:hypothetical protein
MNISADVELHFHEQEKVSVFHETNCIGNDERLAEIGVCTAFAIRIMSNLGDHLHGPASVGYPRSCRVTTGVNFDRSHTPRIREATGDRYCG